MADDYRRETRRAAERYGLDPDIFSRQIQQESGFNPSARSGSGAIGIAQIMPATARGWGVDPTDPVASLNAAAKNMAGYVKKYGGYRNALVAYNAGPGRVGKPLYAETANYIKTILGGSNPTGLGQASGGQGPSADPAAASAPSSPSLLGGGQAGDFTSILSSLMAKPQQQPQMSAIAPPAFAAHPAMPAGFNAAPVIASPTPQPEGGVQAALSLVEALGGQAPTVGSAAAPEGAEGSQASPGIAEGVHAARAAGNMAGMIPLGGSKNAGKGSFEINGPNPGRLQKGLVSFANKVAQVYGGDLVGLDGSTHSKYTVNGNVSEHYSGNATDIFQIGGKPAQGETLLRAGRAALIAAGMPRSKALKAKGGLYNVGNHQIIFLTNEGGNHYDHLHISAH